jgi:TonB-linked SusC/RagA family outer membrane protein
MGAAQTPISGVVQDQSTNETLPGVTIYTNASRTGTTSDMNGKYALTIQAGDDSLTFSYVGYKPQKIAIGGRTTIDILMALDMEVLDEFVVIGYGTQRKSDLTGAISTVGAEEITKVPASNPMQSLQGKVSGLQVSAATGAPGSSPVVRLRGVGTFNDASVLYVVDGVFTNDINFLSSNDIETMTVLKDASATALYGSRGANGVIVVTTKRGRMSDDGKPRFQFDAEYSIQRLDKKIDLLNGKQFAEVLNVINPGTFNNTDRVPNTDWQDLIFRESAPMQSYNFSLSGASEKNQYYLGLGYFKQEGIIPKSDFERVTIKLNNQYSLTDKIRSGVSVIATPSRSHGAANVVANAYRAWPTEEPFNPDGSFADVEGGGNPLASIEYNNNETNALLSLGNIYAEIDFFEGFTFKSSLGYEVEYSSFRSFTPVYRVGPLQENVSSDLTKSTLQRFNWLWENTVSYQKEIKKHRFDALAGFTSQRDKRESLGASTQFLIDEDPNLWYIEAGDNEFLTAFNGAETTSIASYLFRINYVFDNRFLFTANFRRDGSSKFGVNNRYGNFGSVALGWNLMNESFMDGLQSKIQNLKIRGSYGTVGNEKIPWDRQYTLVQNGQNVVLGAEETIVTGASYGVTGNPNLRWETTEQINIGFEFAVLENRLSGEMDYYNKTTSDILLNLQNPGHMGNGAFQFTTYNAAEVRNSGFEFLLNWKDDLRNGIYYEVGVLGATVKNEVLKMGQLAGAGSSISAGGLGNGQLVTLTQVGGPIGAFHGYQVIGIIQNEAQLASTPTLPNAQVGDLLFADTNGDGVLDERDMTEIGSNIPDFIYGFNLNVGYRGFSLGLDFNGQLGNELYNGKDAVRPNQYNYEANVADHWRGEGTSNTEPRPTAAGNNYLQSERFVQNGSFFRLRTATLAYELPEKWINKLKLRRASVYLRGTNLFTITEFTGYTPEIVSSSVLSSGIDLGIYPVTSIYSVGVNLSF